MKGAYILILRNDKKTGIEVGSIGKIQFEKGYYIYVGSALSGEHRLKRHLENLKRHSVKRKHWHIDYIIPFFELAEWYFLESKDESLEGRIAHSLEIHFSDIDGFGACDSDENSHLFKSNNYCKIKEKVGDICLKVNSKRVISGKDFCFS